MKVTILILVDGFLQYSQKKDGKKAKEVTILILVDGFLQSVIGNNKKTLLSLSQSLF